MRNASGHQCKVKMGGSEKQSEREHVQHFLHKTTGNPGSVIVPQYGSSKITVFVWGKNTILKFRGNTK